MDPAAIAGLCTILAHGGTMDRLPTGVTCPFVAVATVLPDGAPTGVDLSIPLAASGARDGLARVAYAEAGNQGDSGLAAVIYAILNRLADGRWGSSVDAVLNARGQFEPVMTAGGDWRRLPPVSAAQQAHVDAILNLILDGRLPDLTHGARYFPKPEDRGEPGAGGHGLSAARQLRWGDPLSSDRGAQLLCRSRGRGRRIAWSKTARLRRALRPRSSSVRTARTQPRPPSWPQRRPHQRRGRPKRRWTTRRWPCSWAPTARSAPASPSPALPDRV